jgi:DNA-binding Xre family transcriptional regulator
MQERQRAKIGAMLGLSKGQIHEILGELFAEGMPKPVRRAMTDAQVRAIHAAYLRGGSIDRLSEAIGFTGSAARHKMHKRGLSLKPHNNVRRPAKTWAHSEQHLITALLLDSVEQKRKARGLTIEHLAHASDLSVSTLQQMRAELSDPRLTTFLRLCNGLGVTPGELVGDLPLPTEARRRRVRATADLQPACSADT